VPRSKQKPVPPPASSGPLRPFTVRQSRRTRLIHWLLFAVLLLGGVVLLIVGVAQGIRDDNGYLVGAFFCGLLLPIAGIALYYGPRNRLVVDPTGVHLTQGRKTRSIPWDQVDDVTVEQVQSDEGKSQLFVQLVFVTPTGKVRSTVGRRGSHGRVWQLAETILYYLDRIRAGTARWEPASDDDATAP